MEQGIKKLDFNGMYRGLVVENGSSTSGGYGKVKIFVPAVYPAEFLKNKELLPWAEPAMGISLACGPTGGTYTTPAINTVVWVFFEGGNHMKPVYFAVTPNSRQWAALNNNIHVMMNDSVAFVIDESAKLADTANIDVQPSMKYDEIKPITPSSENAGELPETKEEVVPEEEKPLVLPGLIINTTRTANGQVHVTVIVNGMLNIVTTGGAFVNSLPMI